MWERGAAGVNKEKAGRTAQEKKIHTFSHSILALCDSADNGKSQSRGAPVATRICTTCLRIARDGAPSRSGLASANTVEDELQHNVSHRRLFLKPLA
jgi:hypothetical protein